MEADAEGNAADIAFLAHHAVNGLVGDHLSSGDSVLVEGLLRVVDGVGAKAVVVDASADLAASPSPRRRIPFASSSHPPRIILAF